MGVTLHAQIVLNMRHEEVLWKHKGYFENYNSTGLMQIHFHFIEIMIQPLEVGGASPVLRYITTPCLCGTEAQTQGFVRARQTLYQPTYPQLLDVHRITNIYSSACFFFFFLKIISTGNKYQWCFRAGIGRKYFYYILFFFNHFLDFIYFKIYLLL